MYVGDRKRNSYIEIRREEEEEEEEEKKKKKKIIRIFTKQPEVNFRISWCASDEFQRLVNNIT